ncbi:MAG: hypothetical protein JXB24_04360 [Bacteroidales bacterium]|nr:hypothetical protein [Bacteroidales bacterium]
MKLVLFLSINRSGSNLILNELSKNPEILVCPEAEALVNHFLLHQNNCISLKSFERIKRKLANDYKFTNWSLNISSLQLNDSVKTYFDAFILILCKYLYQVKPDARIVIFRAERLFQLVDNLSRKNIITYEIKVLCLIRDIRAIYASQKNTVNPDSGKTMSSNPIRTTKYWIWYIQSIQHLSGFYFYQIRYENFILEYNESLIQIFNMLGASVKPLKPTGDLYERMLDQHKKIHKNCTKYPIASRIIAWQQNLSKYEIDCIEHLAEKTLMNLNYRLIHPETNPIALSFLQLKWYSSYITGKIVRNVRYSFKNLIYGSP